MPEKFEQVAPGWYEREGLPAEEQEKFEKLRQGAENVIKCFSLKRSPDNPKSADYYIRELKKIAENALNIRGVFAFKKYDFHS